MKNMLIASTSTLHNGNYLDYLLPEIEEVFAKATTITFIPYARPGGITLEQYTEKVIKTLATIGKKVKGIHQFESPALALEQAEAIFTGGGNTFLLVKMLHNYRLMPLLKQRIESGVPYLGTSAGSNITGLTMGTTNDMPIAYPSSFATIGALPLNINPHYLDPDSNSTHMGETRETRIKEFHCLNNQPVIGLREGSWLRVENNDIFLKGNLTARWFEPEKTPIELNPETNISNLL